MSHRKEEEMDVKVSKKEVLTILKQLKEENIYNQFKYTAYDEAIKRIESMGANDEN